MIYDLYFISAIVVFRQTFLAVDRKTEYLFLNGPKNKVNSTPINNNIFMKWLFLLGIFLVTAFVVWLSAGTLLKSEKLYGGV